MTDLWEKFIIRGNALYNYMIHNFENMFENESSIKNFEIVDIFYMFSITIKNIIIQHNQDIHNQLFLWIKNEFKENRLFDKNLWKPFRDVEVMTDMVLGYRYMFKYNQYYFQLCIDSYYFIDNDFINGIYNNNFAFFELALYGWINENNDKLQPNNMVAIPLNNFMPDIYWDSK